MIAIASNGHLKNSGRVTDFKGLSLLLHTDTTTDTEKFGDERYLVT